MNSERVQNVAMGFVLHLFGPLECRVDGRPLPRLRSRKVPWLLAYLVLRHPREVDRDLLALTLWPDSRTEVRARSSLRTALKDLRRALGPEASRLQAPTPRTLSLDLEGADVDLLAFDAAVAEESEASLMCAVHLYRGPLMEGCDEPWAFQERRAREERYLSALERLACAARDRGAVSEAEEYLRRAVAVDPLREEAQRGLMRVLAAGGNYAAALLVYRDLRLRLHRELNAEPDPATTALFEALRAGRTTNDQRPTPEPCGETARRRDGETADTAPIPSLVVGRSSSVGRAAPSHNLPSHLTRFIGRERELARLCAMLAPPSTAPRLVTLTGVGGCGKTRLALAAAAELAPDYADGVWFVDLASLADPALIPQTVAAALSVMEIPDRSVTESLIEHLKSRDLLLVVDNCEHLIDACARLIEALLHACPGLRVLATSREALALMGEKAEQAPPLQEGEAVELFADRATNARADFRLTATNEATVRAICARLDGLPLAIELAAARVKSLPVAEIARRLDDRFRLLDGGVRTALPRHQTLRAAIDWSYDLLTEPERVLLRRLSVFAGGWTLEAAEHVCMPDALDLLPSLVQKSLVQYEERDAEGRYRLLETVRQYGRERLQEVGEEEVRERHRAYFLGFAEQAECRLEGPEQSEWLKRLELEHDNLRAALRWSQISEKPTSVDARDESSGVEAGLRLAGALWWFWEVHGHHQEGRESLASLLLRAGAEVESSARAKALFAAGVLGFRRGNLDQAISRLNESLELSRGLGDRRGVGNCLYFLGIASDHQGDEEGGASLIEESLALFRQLGDQKGCVWSIITLGWKAHGREDLDRMTELGEESLSIARNLGGKREIAVSLHLLGTTMLLHLEPERAAPLFGESLALAREIGDNLGIDQALQGLLAVADFQQDFERTEAWGQARLDLNRELGERHGVSLSLRNVNGRNWGHGYTLRSLGLAAMHRGEDERAMSLFEERLALNREVRFSWSIADTLTKMAPIAVRQGNLDRARALLRECLEISLEIEWPWILADTLQEVASVVGTLGRPEAAVRMLAAARALHRPEPSAPWLSPPPDCGRLLPGLRAALDAERFATAWAEGEAMSLKDAIAFGLEETEGW